MGDRMQIGEVAERTGLSLRTIRYYGEMDLVVPSARSRGGFRLYTDDDVARLLLIKQMKPLGFQLEDLREVLALLHPSPPRAGDADPLPATEPQRELEQLRSFAERAEQSCVELRARLASAEAFAATLRERLERAGDCSPAR